MTGYVRKDTTNNIADGNVINAADLDSEFDGVQAAFNSSTGHTHDGSSAEGAPITKLGPVQDVTISTTVLGVKTTNTVDLGTSSLKFKDFYLAGNASIGGTLTYGGVTLSNAVTGTGSMVLSASPTITGTITAAAANFSGAVAFNGTTTIGDADTDTITQAASYVTGTQLKSAKTATNTLSLAAYDVDGTAYTNLITLTASNTPTLALTSTGVGTINNMSIGATTASTGAFTTLSASGAVTLSGGTINGVAYLNGTNVLTTGSALTFDGTNLGLGGTNNSYGSQTAMTLSGTNVSRIDFRSNSTFTGTILSYQAVTEGLRLQTEAGYPITFYPAGTEAMRIGVATGGVGAVGIGYTSLTSVGNNGLAVLGNVGIGTSSPGAKLEVYLADGTYVWARENSINKTVGYQIVANGGSPTAVFSSNTATGEVRLGGIATNYFQTFYTNNTERARIDSSGNLGIGTTSPAKKLDIYLGTTGTVGQYLRNTTINLLSQIDGTSSAQFGTETSHPLVFLTANTERARIDSSGNLQLQKNMSVGGATPTTSGTGITFPATQSASSNAKTLDDYEEGTFTPTCTLTTPGTSSTASAVGFYTKVGNLVTVVGRFAFTKGTGSGDLVLGGLPFTSLNTFAYQSSGALTTDSFGVAGKIYYIILALNTTAPTLLAITQAGGAAVLASASDFGAGAISLRYTFSYQTD